MTRISYEAQILVLVLCQIWNLIWTESSPFNQAGSILIIYMPINCYSWNLERVSFKRNSGFLTKKEVGVKSRLEKNHEKIGNYEAVEKRATPNLPFQRGRILHKFRSWIDSFLLMYVLHIFWRINSLLFPWGCVFLGSSWLGKIVEHY